MARRLSYWRRPSQRQRPPACLGKRCGSRRPLGHACCASIFIISLIPSASVRPSPAHTGIACTRWRGTVLASPGWLGEPFWAHSRRRHLAATSWLSLQVPVLPKGGGGGGGDNKRGGSGWAGAGELCCERRSCRLLCRPPHPPGPAWFDRQTSAPPPPLSSYNPPARAPAPQPNLICFNLQTMARRALASRRRWPLRRRRRRRR